MTLTASASASVASIGASAADEPGAAALRRPSFLSAALATRPPAWAALGLFLAVLLTAWGGIEFTRATGRVSAIWVANAIVLATLLRSPVARWPWFLAAGYAGNVAANLLAGDPASLAFLLAACNPPETLPAAAALHRRWGQDTDLSRPEALLGFAGFAVLLGPALSATLAASLLAVVAGAPFLGVWHIWFVADALGMMVFAPLLLILPRADALLAPTDRPTRLRAAGLLAVVSAVTGLVFAQESYPLLFLVLPPLVWAAFALGCAGAAAAIGLATLIAIGMTVVGHGPLHLVAGASLQGRILLLQGFLATAVLIALPVATALAERRRLECALRGSEARFRLLAENTSEFITLRRPREHRRLYASPGCRALLGYEPEEVLPIPLAEIVHPDDLAQLTTALDGLAPGRPRTAHVYRLRHKEGHWVWVETVIRLTADADTGAPLIVASARDFGERKAAEEALAATRDQAEAAATAKSNFLAAMSHEIRTPLTAVIGMADLLAAKPLDGEARRYAEAIRGAGRQLLSVVNDILDFQRLGAGRMRLQEQDFALEALLEEVASVLRPSATEKGLDLDVAAAAGPAAPVGPLRGDPVRLRQVLFNLVGNAVKFTAKGRVAVRCRAAGRPDGRVDLRVEVEDTGVGLEPGAAAWLFRPFTQADASSRRRFGGTGLGLAISKELIELMGGAIGFAGYPGAGSTFWFEVPLARGERRPAAAPAPNGPAARTRPLDILLAEDAPLNRQLLADLLGQRGHRLTMSENGAEFLERAGERRYDLLLVDIQMPVLDGEEALRRLRQREGPNRATPALALTANVMEEDRQRYLAAGFDNVLYKPITNLDLFEELARATAPEPAPEPAEPDPPAVDWSFVAGLLGELPQATVDGFLARALEDARQGFGGLSDPALGAEDRLRLAHRLKGTTRSFGLVGLGDAAEAVERDSRRGLDLQPALARYARALDATAGELAGRRPARPRESPA